MLAWIPRALRLGRVTTRYPRERESPPTGFHGPLVVLDALRAERELEWCCPTGAISVDGDARLRLDRGRCIQCGECIRVAPRRFAWQHAYETAAGRPSGLVVGAVDDADLSSVRAGLAERTRALRRSIHVRHIDTGSDGSEEWEIQALWNPYYDIQRLGFFLTAAPRHADVLLATGLVTPAMRGPLERTWAVMPEPRVLVAVGTDACSGGLSAAAANGDSDGDGRDGDARTGVGIDGVLPVDVYVPGSPPSPIAILHGLLLAVGLLTEGAGR